MTIDEIMQYLVNYGVYGEKYAKIVAEIKKNQDSEFLDEIVAKIEKSRLEIQKTSSENSDETEVEPTVSKFTLPDDIKLAIKQYDYVPIDSVVEKSSDCEVVQNRILSDIDAVKDFGVKTREMHEKIKNFTF